MDCNRKGVGKQSRVSQWFRHVERTNVQRMTYMKMRSVIGNIRNCCYKRTHSRNVSHVSRASDHSPWGGSVSR